MRRVTRQRELGRGERVLPGLWRLRLPLPWPGVPHGNAWAIAAGSGIVLIDTGMHEPGSLAQLERALDQVNLRLEHVRLLACTHAHSDHWGQAGPIIGRAGCELWMHPRHEHAFASRDDPDAALKCLRMLHDAGVAISIDDFGQGQTSLAYLAALPVDELKIEVVSAIRNRKLVSDLVAHGSTRLGKVLVDRLRSGIRNRADINGMRERAGTGGRAGGAEGIA